MGKKTYKTFSEKFGEGEFYPDAAKLPFTDCLDKQLLMLDAKILKNFHGEFGTHDAALMLFVEIDENGDESGQRFTTINSGQVVVERIEAALKMRALPMLCTPTKVKGEYYNLL